MRVAGLLAGIAIIGAAIFLGTSPWRVHGGRFVTEYMIAAGTVGAVGLLIIFLSSR
jgi:hypothetical protein